MPVQMFLDTFLPPDADHPFPTVEFNFLGATTTFGDSTNASSDSSSESETVASYEDVSGNEDAFIAAVHDTGACPDMVLQNTTSRSDSTGKRKGKSDIAIYHKDKVLEEPMRWESAEMIIKIKRQSQDVIKESRDTIVSPELEDNSTSANTPTSVSNALVDSANSALPNTASPITTDSGAALACSQLISYAEAHFFCQFRVFLFSVFISGCDARLLRWDRSGVICTEPFPWRRSPHLFVFLWRFNHLPAFARGSDTTVSPYRGVAGKEAVLALKESGFIPKTHSPKQPLYEIPVHDGPEDREGRRYLVLDLHWSSPSLFGRATFCYVAYDPVDRTIVCIKDCWRTDLEGMQKEGDIYRRLGDRVPNIPGFARDCDVRGEDGRVQITRTQEFINDTWSLKGTHVKPHVHYRIVLTTIGRPLREFTSTRQLFSVVLDAMRAHQAAFVEAKVLHRDISANNILIGQGGQGLLIDWDFSIPTDLDDEDDESKARQLGRTGTWQFISIRRLMEPQASTHAENDDIESFFWVLLYHLLRYRPIHGMDDAKFKSSFEFVFDHHTPLQGGWSEGGEGKMSFL
ncbi:kinase-like domain-containing protein [Gloeopeniophorella convolvens]|nr:kinase-like domain-containing protein [Gloeopeniophorella convolvens]